ncbi:hypothetical protein GCM10027174_15080 [Salinifilum aidingensis]
MADEVTDPVNEETAVDGESAAEETEAETAGNAGVSEDEE